MTSKSLGAIATVCLGIAVACGGSEHHVTHHKPAAPTYHVTLPTGQKVTQTHSPVYAAPAKGQHLPAAIIPIKTAPVRANHAPVVVHHAIVLAPHVAGKHSHILARGPPPVSLVEQWDSVTTSTIPASAHYVAGYVDGNYQTYWLMRGHWPVVVGIAVQTNHGADCFDMEPGNPSPTAAAPWAAWQMTQGNTRPCEYSMLSWFPWINQNLADHGVAVCHTATQNYCVREWDANWTYSEHLDSGFMCTQWTDHAYWRNLDESTCLTSFYSIPKPPPPPDPYAVLLKIWFIFGHDHAAEYYTVKTWYAHSCKTPVHRVVCRTTRAHLILLRDRLWHVSHENASSSPVWGKPVDWSYARRGKRLQLIEAPIGSWTAER